MIRPRVLYIASAGIKDPLIQSQVIGYLRQLKETFECCHLMTFERHEIPSEQRTKISNNLVEDSIHWIPLVAKSGRRSLNIWREINRGCRTAVELIRQHRLNLIHARSFLPGNVALKASKKTGCKFLYDMRGLWSEEKFSKGTIRNRWVRRIAQQMENRLYHQCDALISLTDTGKQWLIDRGVKQPIQVIPCCVDTQSFRWDGRNRTEPKRFISVGSLGPGYLPAAVFGLFAAATRVFPEASLQLLTRSNPSDIEHHVKASGCDPSRIDAISVDPDDVPKHLQNADIGLCMIQPSVAKIASSPTKLAEYFACGLPVIGNCQGIGDMREIILGNRVGIDLKGFQIGDYDRAIHEMTELLQDPALSTRCRNLAEQHFDVHRGVDAYSKVYHDLLSS